MIPWSLPQTSGGHDAAEKFEKSEVFVDGVNRHSGVQSVGVC